MSVIARRTLRAFAERKKYAVAGSELELWNQVADKAKWKDLLDVQKDFSKAEAVRVRKDTYIVFNICGSKFRLIVHIRYADDSTDGTIFVKNFLTHAEYDADGWKTIVAGDEIEREKLRKGKRRSS